MEEKELTAAPVPGAAHAEPTAIVGDPPRLPGAAWRRFVELAALFVVSVVCLAWLAFLAFATYRYLL